MTAKELASQVLHPVSVDDEDRGFNHSYGGGLQHLAGQGAPELT